MWTHRRPFILLFKNSSHICCSRHSWFIKGVAVSTRLYVALRFVFVFFPLSHSHSLSPSVSPPTPHPSKHCGRATHDLDREDWQPCLAPGLWSAISTSKLKLDPHFITSHTSIFVTKRHLTVSTILLSFFLKNNVFFLNVSFTELGISTNVLQ